MQRLQVRKYMDRRLGQDMLSVLMMLYCQTDEDYPPLEDEEVDEHKEALKRFVVFIYAKRVSVVSIRHNHNKFHKFYRPKLLRKHKCNKYHIDILYKSTWDAIGIWRQTDKILNESYMEQCANIRSVYLTLQPILIPDIQCIIMDYYGMKLAPTKEDFDKILRDIFKFDI